MASSKQITVPGHRLIEPLQQGELDGLCGLYAILNAARLVYAPTQPLTKSHTDQLFADGIGYLGDHGLLARATTRDLLTDHQAGLAFHVANSLRETFDRPVSVRPLSVTSTTYEAIIQAAVEDGLAVCVLLNGALNHFTVISGISATRFMLFDSAGHVWVRRANCQLSSSREQARHRIKRSALFTLGRSR